VAAVFSVDFYFDGVVAFGDGLSGVVEAVPGYGVFSGVSGGGGVSAFEVFAAVGGAPPACHFSDVFFAVSPEGDGADGFAGGVFDPDGDVGAAVAFAATHLLEGDFDGDLVVFGPGDCGVGGGGCEWSGERIAERGCGSARVFQHGRDARVTRERLVKHGRGARDTGRGRAGVAVSRRGEECDVVGEGGCGLDYEVVECAELGGEMRGGGGGEDAGGGGEGVGGEAVGSGDGGAVVCGDGAEGVGVD